MITAIDETGDFNPSSNKKHFFVAAHIDQNLDKYKLKYNQFNEWEKSIPKINRNLYGEAKGQLLTDKQITEFYKNVIETSPKIHFSVVRVIPAENSKELLNKFKEIEISSLKKIIEQASINNKPKLAKSYQNIQSWYNNRNYQTIIKMKCLSELINMSITDVVAYSQIRYLLDKNDETNISKMCILIDKDFVRSDNIKVLWRELLRQSWVNSTKDEGIPVLDYWKELDHPLFKYFPRKDNNVIMTPLFKKGILFKDSSESWEVRIADIIGTILHRNSNYENRFDDIVKDFMRGFNNKRKNYRHIILNPFI